MRLPEGEETDMGTAWKRERKTSRPLPRLEQIGMKASWSLGKVNFWLSWLQENSSGAGT